MKKMNRRSLLKGVGVSLAGGIFINGVLTKVASGEEKMMHGLNMPPMPAPGKIGIKIVKSEVIHVVADKKYVITAGGNIDYNYLLVATGIRIADEDILSLIEHPAANSHAWELGE